MESQPQNPEFRINPENFHPFIVKQQMHSYFVCVEKKRLWRDCTGGHACLSMHSLLSNIFYVKE